MLEKKIKKKKRIIYLLFVLLLPLLSLIDVSPHNLLRVQQELALSEIFWTGRRHRERRLESE